MGLLSAYANQTLTWKSKTSVNEWNEATYSTTSIKGRFEYKRRIVQSTDGKELISEARLFTESHVLPDDVITYDGIDWSVISISDVPGIDGSVQFYEVLL